MRKFRRLLFLVGGPFRHNHRGLPTLANTTGSNKETPVTLLSGSNKETPVTLLSTYFNISPSKAEHLCLKHPVINKLTEDHLESLINTLHDMGYENNVLLENPVLFSMLPVTLKFRFRVLRECGLEHVNPTHISSYLPLIKQKTIGELKRSGDIPKLLNVENRLASCMSQWPTSLTTLVDEDVNKMTLYVLRMKIIQRYLELVLDLNEVEFYRAVQTYPTVKHRPLNVINETLTVLQGQVMMPLQKIKSNLYLVHADPDNIKDIICKFRSIGGIDIREILRRYPKLATKNYGTLVKIKNVLEEYQIGDEAQTKCFEIYTLGPSTIRERLERAREIPEFHAFYNHPRFLEIIYYKKTATKRLIELYENNKKCISLNVLSGGAARYEVFEKLPGDRLGKGRDLVFCIAESLGNAYSNNDIRNVIKRHPFWINIPLVSVKFVYQQLSKQFTSHDIYRNCHILLYPWNKIRDVLVVIAEDQKQTQFATSQEHLDLGKLNDSQKLSLALYLLEKNHYFTGNGVWTEEKTKHIQIQSNFQGIKTQDNVL